MNSGVVIGGWEYVWAAYGITVVALTVYAVSLFARLRRNDGDQR